MNPLVNVLTPKARAIAYAILFVGALGFAAWQAAEGDWVTFVGSLITSLLGLTAASNASWTPENGLTEKPVPVKPKPDDTYEAEEEALPNTDSIHGGTGYSEPVSGNDFGYTYTD